MRLTDVIRGDCVKTRVKLSSKEEALRRVAALAVPAVGHGMSEQDIYEALLERENLCSTGVGKNIAIPHCRLSSLDEFVVGLIVVPDGVAFDSLDGEPARLIFSIIGPEERKREQIHLLSVISHLCRKDGAVERLLECSSPGEVMSALAEIEEPRKETLLGEKKDMFQIYVRDDEELFTELLEVLVSFETTMVSVVETTEPDRFLAFMPLYMGLMSGTKPMFNRLIVACIDRSMTSELIRRIEVVTGPLSTRDDVFVAVQQLLLARGRIRD